MIRFNCPTCDRPYLLADAYAGLPLVCKGCNGRLTPPAPQPDEPPPPPVPVRAAPVQASGGGKQGEPPDAAKPPGGSRPPPAPAPVPVPPQVGRPEVADLPLADEVEDPPPPPVPPQADARGSPARSTPGPGFGRRLVAGVVDLVVVVVLLAGGAMLGEEVVRRPSRAVVEEAGSAPQFPPTDLLLWGGCVLVLPLVYALLGARGASVGGWLKRRG